MTLYKLILKDLLIKQRLSPQGAIFYIETYKEQLGIENLLKSKTSIYNGIKKNLFEGITMQDLVGYGEIKSRNKIRKYLQKERSIDDRPENVNNRSEPFHWEMDCLCGGKQSSKTVLVLTERKTRMQIIELLEEQTQSEVIKALDRLEVRFGNSFPKIFKSITMDNGSEFLDFASIELSARRKFRTFTYYCHPGRPGERGSNENANKHIRRFLHKSSNFDLYVDELLVKEVEYWMNYIFHRGILKGKCSGYVFEKICEEHRIELPEKYFNTS